MSDNLHVLTVSEGGTRPTTYRIFYRGGDYSDIDAYSPEHAIAATRNDSGDQYVVAVVDAYLITEGGRGDATSNLLGYLVGGQ